MLRVRVSFDVKTDIQFCHCRVLHFSFSTANACFPNVIFGGMPFQQLYLSAFNNVDDALGQLPRIPRLEAV